MAKNKNRKKNAKKGSVSPSVPVNKEKAAPQSTQAPAIKTQAAAIKEIYPRNDSANSKNLVRLSTCVAGMFLSFVFGIYLGSFLPGIISGMEEDQSLTDKAHTIQSAKLPENPMQMEKPMQIQSQDSATASVDPAIRTIPREIREHLDHLEKEALVNPQDARLWTELGNTYFDIQEPAKAIEAYGRSLAISPDNPDVLTDLGIMYREVKNYDKALECFRKASRINPSHINALFNEGVVLSADLGRKEEAASVWQKVLAIRPDATTPDGHKLSDMVRQLQ